MNRMAEAAAHELRVVRELEVTGFTVTHFGQSQLPEYVRVELRRWHELWLRWLPDLLVTGCDIRPFLVDAKAGRCDTTRFTIELSALEAHEGLEVALNMAIVYACPDLTWTTPALVRRHGNPGPASRRGSGTPYLLYPRITCCQVLSEIVSPERKAAA